jgi:hypothetical protein
MRCVYFSISVSRKRARKNSKFSELFSPQKRENNILITEYCAQRETRDQQREIKNPKILPQKKDFKFIGDVWRTFKYPHRALKFWSSSLRCFEMFINGVSVLFCVLLFSIIMLLKLHLFHSSLSQFTPLFLFLILSYSSFPLSFSSFLSFSLSLSPPLFVAGSFDPPRTSSEQKRARKTLSLSLSLSLVKNKKNYKAFFTAATVSASKALISANMAATLAALASCMTAETILSPLEST